MNQHRLEVLRAFRESGWQQIPQELQAKHAQRAISWLVEKGFLERHPEHFLTEVRITTPATTRLRTPVAMSRDGADHATCRTKTCASSLAPTARPVTD